MTAKKKAELSVVDQLAEDAAPPDYPKGAPKFVPFLQVRPFSKRAEVKRKFAEFQAVRDKVLELQKLAGLEQDEDAELTPEQEEARMGAWADVDDVMQLMDDLLRLCAADEDAYQKWSANLEDDNELSSAFSAFMARSQPGEASSSTS